MKRLKRKLVKRKNLRRSIAGVFVFIALVEVGSHAFMDSHDPAALDAITVCRVDQNPSPALDCPENQKQRQESKNLKDEMNTHTVVLSSLTVPLRWATYDIDKIARQIVHPLSGKLSSPFHPPEQA